MSVRLKKLVGTIVLVILVLLYALIATTVATLFLADAHWVVHLVYFLVTGLVWVVPAMWLISWMERVPRR